MYFLIFIYCFKDFIYLFILEKVREGEREVEKHQCVVASCTPLLGIWPATQACALTGNQTSDPLVCRPVLNPLSHTSQGWLGSVLENKLFKSKVYHFAQRWWALSALFISYSIGSKVGYYFFNLKFRLKAKLKKVAFKFLYNCALWIFEVKKNPETNTL